VTGVGGGVGRGGGGGGGGGGLVSFFLGRAFTPPKQVGGALSSGKRSWGGVGRGGVGRGSFRDFSAFVGGRGSGGLPEGGNPNTKKNRGCRVFFFL